MQNWGNKCKIFLMIQSIFDEIIGQKFVLWIMDKSRYNN